jgi:hypothetical protein
MKPQWRRIDMAGLIWAGIGKGLADAGTAINSTVTRAMERDEAAKIRAQERAEDQQIRKDAAAALLQDRRDAREDRAAQDALYRKLASDKGGSGSGGGGSGGFSVEDIGEGGNAEPLIAREAGMDVPTLRSVRRASETGDKSAFASGVTGAPLGEKEMGPPKPVYNYPEGFEKEFDAKVRTLAAIEQKFVFGNNYDNVTKGAQNQFGLDMAKGVVGGTMNAGTAGTGVAVMEGKPLYGGDSNQTRQNYTGETKETSLGASARRENEAQAGKARTEGGGAGEARIQGEITRAENALGTATERASRLFREPTIAEKTNPEAARKYESAKRAAIENDPDVVRQRKRVEELNASGSTAPASKPVNNKPAAPAAKNQAPAAKAGDNTGNVKSYKVGETRKIATGPNAGKTARWDGRGWTLAN